MAAAEPRLAIAVGANEAVIANPFVVADDGFAAAIVAIWRDVYRRTVCRGDDDGSGAAEAESDEDLRLRLGWGREEECAGGNSGDYGLCNESFYVCDFHNGLLTTHG